MGVRIMTGANESDGAVLYCSTSMWAFGPIFEDAESAQAFLEWLGTDPRLLTDSQLERKHSEWMIGAWKREA